MVIAAPGQRKRSGGVGREERYRPSGSIVSAAGGHGLAHASEQFAIREPACAARPVAAWLFSACLSVLCGRNPEEFTTEDAKDAEKAEDDSA